MMARKAHISLGFGILGLILVAIMGFKPVTSASAVSAPDPKLCSRRILTLSAVTNDGEFCTELKLFPGDYDAAKGRGYDYMTCANRRYTQYSSSWAEWGFPCNHTYTDGGMYI